MDSPPILMISEATFYGGARSEAPSVTTAIGEADVRVIVYRPTASVDVFLPPLDTQKPGGPRFYLVNDSGFTLTIKRSTGAVITSLGPKGGGAGSPQVRMFLVSIADWAVKSFTSEFGVTS